ncbi:hypothetical protein M8J77_026021 [Diaphorina citri]|nr:hypothetical protein M8J77_026021 [Diaphorina citri]
MDKQSSSLLLLAILAAFNLNLCTSQSQTPAPAVNGTTPAVNGTTPAVNGTTPAANGTTPAGNGITSSEKPKGKFEYTNLTKAAICIPNNNESISYCETKLKAQVEANFHPELKLANLTEGKCVYLSDGPEVTGSTPAGNGTTPPGNGTTPAGNGTTPAGTTPAGTTPAGNGTTPAPGGAPTGPLRCTITGLYTTPGGVQERVRLNFFNNVNDPKGKDNVIMVMGYYGNASQSNNLVETPLK